MKAYPSTFVLKVLLVAGLTVLSGPCTVSAFDLFVSSLGSKTVTWYDGRSGLAIGGFGGFVDFPEGLTIGRDGNLYVSSASSGSASSLPFADTVVRFNGRTGEFINVFVTQRSGGLNGPLGLAFGPDGNLYVSSFGTDSVLRYNGSTGAFIDTFAFGGGLDGPEGLTFGPDGNLYVVSGFTDAILRYDGSTGAFIDAFVFPGSGGLSGPEDLTFGPDGNLYVDSVFTDSILRYNGNTGAFIDVFVTAGSGDLRGPAGLRFGRDGNLYVANPGHAETSNSVLRYNGKTGDFIDAFIPSGSGGLSGPSYLTFTPITAPPDIDVQPPFWNYDEIAVNSSAYKTFTVGNDGLETLNVSTTTIVGSDAGQFSIVSGGESFDLEFGETRDITVKFSPTSGGLKVGALRIFSNDQQGPIDVTLNGIGTGANAPPFVMAGTPQGITFPASVTLYGTVSDDGLPNPPGAVTLAWSLVSGPGTVTFSSLSTLSTNVTFSQGGEYVLRLTANDGDLSSSDEVQIIVNNAPNAPAGLGQFKSDGTTAITVGGTTGATTLVFKATVSDPDLHETKLQVEVKPIGTSFTNVSTAESSFSSNGETVQVTVTNLLPVAYHWQARAVDTVGGASAWISFGGNAETSSDFIVTPNHILTVASTNPASGAAITVSPNDNSNLSNGITPFTRIYNDSVQVTLIAAPTAGVNTFGSWSGCDSVAGTTCNVTMSADKTVMVSYLPLVIPQVALTYDGQLKDKVGQGEFVVSGDGQLDGTFTVTLLPSSGNRTVTGLSLTRAGPIGVWDTIPNDQFWVLGGASRLDDALYNASNGTVSFPVTAGDSFKIFASDLISAQLGIPSGLFTVSSVFAVTVSFLDGSTASASTTIIELPTVTIAATTPNAAEGGGAGAFTVSRTEATTSSLTVHYTVGGTATNKNDYSPLSGNVTIPPSSSTAVITVVPVDDSAVEGNETVVVTLSASAAYTLGSANSATVTIADNDGSHYNPTIGLSFDGMIRDRVGQNEFALSPDGQLDGVFTVTLVSGSGNRTVTRLQLNRAGPIGVWDTEGGDGFWSLGAANGLDTPLFTGVNDAVDFSVAEGSSFKIFAADYLGQMFGPGSVFTVMADFSDGSTAAASITIVELPTVNIVATTPNAAEGGASGVFTITRTGSTTSPLTVDYIVSGSATDGQDYETLSDSVIILSGQSSAIITVVPIDDSALEGSETVIVTLTGNAAYSLGSPNSATVTIQGNDGEPSNPTIALSFDGMIRDKVGQNEFALNPDGQSDGVFTVTLNPGSGNRTVNRLQLNRAGPIGVWDTQGGAGFWSLGVASGLDILPLLNAANDSVNFAVTEGNSFTIFAADYQGQMFMPGSGFTLTVNFADGSMATGNANVP